MWNVFDFSLKLNGYPIKQAKKDLSYIQSLDDKAYKLHLEAKKKHIVEHHLENNSFYKKFSKKTDFNDWNSLPILTKKDFQTPLKDRLSKGFTLKNCHIHKTSGSSGIPLAFAKDKYCHAFTWATFIDRYGWFDIDINKSKQARFYGIPLNKMAYFKERFKDVLSNRFRFSVFDMSQKELEKNLEKFSKSKFYYINGYTSAIVRFTKFLERKNIILKEVCPSLQVCIVTAEVLFHNDKLLLEKQLGVPVVNEYGSAELGLIAFNNKNNDWIVNTEDLFVEIIDDNNTPLPLGEKGRVVITSLHNKAHPFIRYEIGDFGRLSTSSSIKRPILKSLVGRTNDFASLPSGKKAAGLTFYYITKTIIDDSNNIKEFVIEQITLNTFKISYTSTKPLSKLKIKAIKKAIEVYLEPDLIILFERKKELKRTEAGKLKQFTSYVD